jgi:hypothetical protein
MDFQKLGLGQHTPLHIKFPLQKWKKYWSQNCTPLHFKCFGVHLAAAPKMKIDFSTDHWVWTLLLGVVHVCWPVRAAALVGFELDAHV